MFAILRIGAIIALGITLLAAGGGAVFFGMRKTPPAPVVKLEPIQVAGPVEKVIGTSVEGREIRSYTYGKGPTHLAFVGGMHGGYEWNAVLLAYQFMQYLNENPAAIPDVLSVTVIPDINPDGTFKVIGKEGPFTLADVPNTGDESIGRTNANGVDLNRNFGCNWQPNAVWRSKPENAGTAAFSEPEARAMRDFATTQKPSAVVFWHSQANAVYASECNDGILPQTLDIMNAYAKAAGYPAVKSFDSYKVTGDSEGWLASIGIPALTVELKTHKTVEWNKNLAGIQALFDYYSKR